MDTQTGKNLILAIGLSLLVLIGWQYVFPPEPPPPEEQTSLAEGTPQAGAPSAGAGTSGSIEGLPITDSDGSTRPPERMPLPVNADEITGSINLANGRFDDVVLNKFREEVDPTSDPIKLFSPRGSEKPYYAEFSWIDPNDRSRRLARGETPWVTTADNLTTGTPIVMTWDDGQDIVVERTISIDEHFMFTVTDTVTNNGSQPVTLLPFGRISRTQAPEYTGTYILHVGPIGVFDETLEEVDFDDLEDDGDVVFEDKEGWLGITDKFWLAAMAPNGDTGRINAAFRYVDQQDRYQVDYQGSARTIAPGASSDASVHLFVGAKEINILDSYEEALGIDRFDMAIDFGYFFFLTKPLLSVLIYFAELFGNFGLSILAITVIIKLIFFPLANKSYVSMSKMKALQPKITELREQHGADKQRMQTELMALYKREKANPVAGCLPIALQIPVFFALYKVLFVSIEMRHAPFYGWIKDLSAADPTTVANLFGLIPWTPPEFLMLGAWPLIMGVSMFLQQKLNPAPPDPVQAKIFMLMPIMFTFFLAGFPAGLVIYWSWNNILSMTQQYVIMRRMGVAVGGGKTK
jgi:YidC/Oxa1 family membrane protein insertase